MGRTIAMTAHYCVQLVIRPVYPMVMRKLNVSNQKTYYIINDMKRESDIWNFPFAKNRFQRPIVGANIPIHGSLAIL